MIVGAPAAALRNHVSRYVGFREETPAPVRRREGPGIDVVVIVSFEEEWLIDEQRHTSFVGGLRETQVTTEHGGRSFGMQIDLAPTAAFALFGPLDDLANTVVPLEDVLPEPTLVEQLAETDWDDRFELLDHVLWRRLGSSRPASAEVVWAWQQLLATRGRARVGALADELGWSRRRLVARFREQIGLPPKAAARMIRFDHARALAERSQRPDWARIAFDCGYYDQSHLINDFRSVTGRTPVTFFQDGDAAAT
jgi:AraC-like DNA-binding protein